MRYLFEFLLLLYPKQFRRRFAEEMLATFEQLRREQIGGETNMRVLFVVVREFVGLLRGAASEQVRLRRSPNPGTTAPAHLSTVAELEQCIQFHSSETVACIASHRFEGARFHAAQEEEARAKLRMLKGAEGKEGGA